MNFIFNRKEVECLRDALKREFYKCEDKLREQLLKQFNARLGQGEVSANGGGWAPVGHIRSNWPSSHIKKTSKRDQYFRQPRDKKQVQKAVKHLKTAAEILAELSTKP